MDPLRSIVQDQEGGATLSVHVQPNSSRTECVGIYGDAVKIRVAAPPVDGAANEELIRFIADQCRISRQHVLIRTGTDARRKRVLVRGVTAERLWARLLPQGSKGMVKR